MKIGVSVWRVLCKETKLDLLQNAMQESKSPFPLLQTNRKGKCDE